MTAVARRHYDPLGGDTATARPILITSQSEIDASPLAGRRLAEQATANVSCSKLSF